MTQAMSLSAAILALFLLTVPAAATPFFITGSPDGRMAIATRPDSAGKFEIEAADDFVLTAPTSISNATFTGLLTGGATTANIGAVRVEIYRVFPADSNVGRTSGPPTFSTPLVPTRVNSPSDVELDDRDTASPPGNLTFTASALGVFTALNSVQPGGIHPAPGQTTGGDGPITGQAVELDVTFTTPLLLAPDHYFFVPQVEVTTAGGEFFWLSAARPTVAPGTPFVPDLQAWTRAELLDPDWLRVGTDIVGGATPPTFNAAFSLTGTTIPEPATSLLFGLAMIGALGWQRARKP